MAVVSGGTTLIDNGALDAGVSTGSLTLLSTQTASASASIEFTSGIDSTYDSYVFKFINCHANTNGVYIQFQASINGGSSYGVTITSTAFDAYHLENDTSPTLTYEAGNDLAQSTSFQRLCSPLGNDSDDNISGTLQIFNPSSTTFVKHWLYCSNQTYSTSAPLTLNNYFAGYFNDGANDINAIKFEVSSGTFDGIIKMYGVA